MGAPEYHSPYRSLAAARAVRFHHSDKIRACAVLHTRLIIFDGLGQPNSSAIDNLAAIDLSLGEGGTQRTLIHSGRNGSRSCDYTDCESRNAFLDIQRIHRRFDTRIDDTYDLCPFRFRRFRRVGQPVRRRSIACYDDNLGRGMTILAKHKLRIPDDKFAEKVSPALRAVKTVRHVRLISKIDEILRCEIGASVRATLPGGILELVHRQQLLEHCKTARSGIEHTDWTFRRAHCGRSHRRNRT